MTRRRDVTPANPYPDGTRRQNALMLLWMRLSESLPNHWALKTPFEIGMTEYTRIKIRDPNHRIQLTNLVRGLASREEWRYKGDRHDFRLADGMTYGTILDCYFDKEEEKKA